MSAHGAKAPKEAAGARKSTLLVNVLGGPGLGKRALCDRLAKELEEAAGLECAVFSGLAKEAIAAGAGEQVREGGAAHQSSILDLQERAVARSWGKVDVVLTDCSPIQGVQYVRERGEGWERALKKALDDYRKRADATLNLYLERGSAKWSGEGRVHTYEEARQIDAGVLRTFVDYGLPYKVIRLHGGADAEDEERTALMLVMRRLGLAPAGAEEQLGPGADVLAKPDVKWFVEVLSAVGWPAAHVAFVAAALEAGWPLERRAELVRCLPDCEGTVRNAKLWLETRTQRLDEAVGELKKARASEQLYKGEVAAWARQNGVPVPDASMPEVGWERAAEDLKRRPPRPRRRSPQSPAEEREWVRKPRKLEPAVVEDGGGAAGGESPKAARGERKEGTGGPRRQRRSLAERAKAE